MAGQSSAMFGCSRTEVSVLGSNIFGQAVVGSHITLSTTVRRKKTQQMT